MKTFLILILTVYQKIVSPLLHQLLGQASGCRYEKSCSAFAKDSITKHGVLKGGKMSLVRLFSCQPFISFKPYARSSIS